MTTRAGLRWWWMLVGACALMCALSAHGLHAQRQPQPATRHPGIVKECDLLVTQSIQASLPSPPVSPAPVVNYEYDAQGNPTKTTCGDSGEDRSLGEEKASRAMSAFAF